MQHFKSSAIIEQQRGKPMIFSVKNTRATSISVFRIKDEEAASWIFPAIQGSHYGSRTLSSQGLFSVHGHPWCLFSL